LEWKSKYEYHLLESSAGWRMSDKGLVDVMKCNSVLGRQHIVTAKWTRVPSVVKGFETNNETKESISLLPFGSLML
jgi:hypothetical protein